MTSGPTSGPTSGLADYRVVAGLDEAGYGPMLGPLTIGVSAFRVSSGGGLEWEQLEGSVSKRPSDDGTRLVVADSKKVFTRNPRGERRLELTALAFRGAAGGAIGSGADFICGAPEGIAPSEAILERHPWYAQLPAKLPSACTSDQLAQRCTMLESALHGAGAAAIEAYALVIPAGQLNESFSATSNKGATLWSFNSKLILRLFESYGAEGLDLVVDRLGGRARYGRILSELIPFSDVRVCSESRQSSEYAITDASNRRMRIRFVQKGDDRFMAVALASCLAKYARELTMGAFNAYFRDRCPDLRPTAGYVTDARRWLGEVDGSIAAELQKRDVLVRAR